VELDGSTFLLEVVNFLVLVWILRRFFYQPVLDVIESRRRRIEQALAEAREGRSEAQALRTHYEGRLAAWEEEKQAARAELQGALEQQRLQELESLRETLAREREKVRVQDERREAERRRQDEEEALRLGARFAARLLERLAGPETDARVLALVAEDLAALPAEERAALRRAWDDCDGAVEVVSARPLDPGRRAALEAALGSLLGAEVRCDYHVEPALVAGVRISLGPWSLAANVQDELRGFADAAREPG
jgi:F-type H+-transporting ATPase subunit b